MAKLHSMFMYSMYSVSKSTHFISNFIRYCVSKRYVHSRRFPVTWKISDNCVTCNRSLMICSYIINFVYLWEENISIAHA